MRPPAHWRVSSIKSPQQLYSPFFHLHEPQLDSVSYNQNLVLLHMLPLVTSYRTNSHRTRVIPFSCPAPFNILCLKSMPPQGRKINHLFTHSFIPQCLPGCRLPPRFLSHIDQQTEQGKAPVLLELMF